MSLESWMAEFMPLDAYDVSEADALEHSLRKWSGLLPDALSRHDVSLSGQDLREKDGGAALVIDEDSCALCVHHRRDNVTRKFCQACPLLASNDGLPCDSLLGPLNHYHEFTNKGNPRPMINLLRSAQRRVAKENALKEKAYPNPESMRYLAVVIQQVLALIPEEESALIIDLNEHLERERYRAPEVNDWVGVSNTLFKHMQGREKLEWASKVLALWRDDPRITQDRANEEALTALAAVEPFKGKSLEVPRYDEDEG